MLLRAVACCLLVVGLVISVGCSTEPKETPVIQQTPPTDAPKRTGKGPVSRTRGGTGRGDGAARSEVTGRAGRGGGAPQKK